MSRRPVGPERSELRDGAHRLAKETAALQDLVEHGARLARSVGRTQSAEIIEAAGQRVGANRVDVLVTGAFKSGKTTLINSLLGQRVIPADLLSTTTIPVFVEYGSELSYEAVLLDESNGRLARYPIDRSRLSEVVVSPSSRIEGHLVDHLRIRHPSPLLQLGLRLIDSPGFSGGVRSATASRLADLAHRADAVLMVADASQELSASEIHYLSYLREVCPLAVVVMTRTDLFSEWTTVLERNELHLLETQAEQIPLLAVGAGLLNLGARLGDRQLERESGYALLSWFLAGNLVASANYQVLRSSTILVRSEIHDVRESLVSRLDSMASVEGRREVELRLDEQRQRLHGLKADLPALIRRSTGEISAQLEDDLEAGFQTVSAQMREVVRRASSHEEGTEVEQRCIAAVNDLWSHHLISIDQAYLELLKRLKEEYGLDLDDLLMERAFDPAEVGPTGGHVDLPAYDRSTETLQRNYSIMRGGAAGGSLGLGLLGTGVIGVLAAVPVVGLAAGAGGWIGVKLLNRHQKGISLDQWKQRAESAVLRYLDQSQRQLFRGSQTRRKALGGSFDEAARAEIDLLIRRAAEEADRLERLRVETEHTVPEVEQALRTDIERFDALEAFGRRLDLRLDRPELEVYRP